MPTTLRSKTLADRNGDHRSRNGDDMEKHRGMETTETEMKMTQKHRGMDRDGDRYGQRIRTENKKH